MTEMTLSEANRIAQELTNISDGLMAIELMEGKHGNDLFTLTLRLDEAAITSIKRLVKSYLLSYQIEIKQVFENL